MTGAIYANTVRLVGGRSHNKIVPQYGDPVLQIGDDAYFRVGYPWGPGVMATEDIKKVTNTVSLSHEHYRSAGPQVIAKLVEELTLAVEDAYLDPATTIVVVAAEGSNLTLTAYALAEPLSEDDPENNG